MIYQVRLLLLVFNLSTGVISKLTPEIQFGEEEKNITMTFSDQNNNSENHVVTTEYQAYNQSNGETRLNIIYKQLVYIQDVYILPPVCFIGIIGNSLVAKVLYSKRGSNSSFIYMFAVIVCDTLSLVSDLFLPISTLLKKTNSDIWRSIAENMHFWNRNFVSYVLRGTAFNILCVLSFERLIAIKYPLKLRNSCTVRYPHMFLLLSLLIGTVSIFSVPFFTEIRGKYDQETNTTKFERAYTQLFLSNPDLHNKIVLVLRFFAGPLQIFFFCITNVIILNGIYQNKKQLLTMKVNNSRAKSSKILQVKLCKIFLVLCIINIVAFMPNSFTVILAKIFPQLNLKLQSATSLLWTHGGNFLRVINSASDFIVMITMSTEIRYDVKEIIKGFAKKTEMNENIPACNSSNLIRVSTLPEP